MKLVPIAFAIMLFLKYNSQNADAITGKWSKTDKEDLIIEVCKSNNAYEGKATWAKTKDKKKSVGFIIPDGLRYNSKSKNRIIAKSIILRQVALTQLQQS